MALQRAPLSLKGRALRLLASREHSRAELERKLAPHEREAGEMACVLDELQSRNLINEQRVVDCVLHRRAQSSGASRIAQELQDKGVSDALVSDALISLRATEFERAQQVWQRRFGELPIEPKDVARQARFLASRGFQAGVIARVLQADIELE